MVRLPVMGQTAPRAAPVIGLEERRAQERLREATKGMSAEDSGGKFKFVPA